jgi:hypothetical protein
MIALVLLMGCPGGDGDSVPATPTFAEIQAEVFTPGCAFSSCHGNSSPAAGLDLSDGVAWGNIVGATSTADATRTLVVPGDPEGSYLYLKCAGDASIVDDPMPPSAGLDAERLTMLHDWIAAGAAND